MSHGILFTLALILSPSSVTAHLFQSFLPLKLFNHFSLLYYYSIFSFPVSLIRSYLYSPTPLHFYNIYKMPFKFVSFSLFSRHSQPPSLCPLIQCRLAVSYWRTLLIGCQLWLVNNISPQRQEPRLLEWILDTNLRINLNSGDNNTEPVSADARAHGCQEPSETSSSSVSRGALENIFWQLDNILVFSILSCTLPLLSIQQKKNLSYNL